MVSKVLITLMVVFVVAAAAFNFEEDDDEALDIEFLKRDPVMQEYLTAAKRGKSMKKYKPCDTMANCYCSRRTNKPVYCGGQGEGI